MAGSKDKVKDADRFSILVPSLKTCFICGTDQRITLHEVFGGTANRKKSKEDGMILPLCFFHHNGSNQGIEYNQELDLYAKKQAEKIWIQTYATECESVQEKIDKFIKRYGKNYLDDEDIIL